MAEVAFVLGNGESRKGIEINDLKEKGKVFACNGVYRTHRPDYLVAVDPKMLLEIAEGDYLLHNKVWSNFNAQYNKHPKILDHVQWFKPSLGWSSGPTALRMACEHGHKDIYILGFDYQGHKDKDKGNTFKFNKNGAIMPRLFTLVYALSIATSGQAERILLAGFDGYGNNDVRTKTIDELLHLYSSSTGSRPLLAVTPTTYSINSTSIYAL